MDEKHEDLVRENERLRAENYSLIGWREKTAELSNRIEDIELRLKKALVCANVPVGTARAVWVKALENAWRYATGNMK